MRPSTLKLCEDHLFSDLEQMKASRLTESQINAMLRTREAYTMMLESPSLRDIQIVNFIVEQYGVSRAMAYNDVKLVKSLIGSFNKASKDWHLWRFNLRNEETRQMALAGEDYNAAARADHSYGIMNKLNQEDVPEMDWSTIQVQPFVPTDDPTVIGLKPDPDIMNKIEKLEKKYNAEIQAVDVDYEDVTFDLEELYKTDKEVEDDKWQ